MGCCARLAPPPPLPVALTFSVFLNPRYLSLFLPIFFSGSLNLRRSFSHSLALLPFGHAEAALSQHGHPGCPEEVKRPGSQRSSPPRRNKKETGTSFSPLLLLTRSVCPYCWFYSPEKDAASPLLPRWTFTCSTCLIVCVWLWCSGSFVFFSRLIGSRPSVWLTDEKKVILLLLCDNTVQTFPICLSSLLHYRETVTETCLLWWIQYLKKLSSFCKLFFL